MFTGFGNELRYNFCNRCFNASFVMAQMTLLCHHRQAAKDSDIWATSRRHAQGDYPRRTDYFYFNKVSQKSSEF